MEILDQGVKKKQPLLLVNKLSSGYKPLQILWDVHMNIFRGEWVALLGPNGSGKSTLLKTIVGLLKTFGGEIEYEKEKIGTLKVHQRVKLGISMVPENRRLFAGMTVRENLMIGAYLQGDSKQTAGQLERVYTLFPILNQRQKQIAGTLSGGEGQMCAIGRALMTQPRLLLVDEMSQGLAPKIVDDLLEVMLAINREGVTLLVVEQDVHTALIYADRGYVLSEGLIVKSAQAKTLIADPSIRKEYLGI